MTMSPNSAVGTSVSEITVTFDEPVALNAFIPAAITLTGPDGSVAVSQPILSPGNTYDIKFSSTNCG